MQWHRFARRPTLVLLAALSLFGMSPGRADESAELEFFEREVRPLLIDHCYQCHSDDEDQGGLLLDSKNGWVRGGDSGPVITVGHPEQSLLVEAVGYRNLDLQMPPDGKLADEKIEVLRKWIEMGAPDPRPDPRQGEAGSTARAPEGMSIAEGRQFWSLQPVANPTIPEVQDAAWVRSPVDAFILKRLEEERLRPADAADRATLLRRVTFNLTGLPPTPQQLAAFQADKSPDAFARVVDRLLESPAYAEHWGRHWLDVARYADSNGLDENIALGNAWRYRDYIVDAFNKDKPYDRFLIEQLAGDLLPEANQTTITATGFLTLGAKVLAEPDLEKLMMDTVDEQLDTVGKVFMGMTMGCARCHDHKFDPLKQADYYSLAAIFRSTKTFSGKNTGAIKYWNEHSFASDAEHESLKKINAQIAAAKSAAASVKNKAIAAVRTQAESQAVDYLVASCQLNPDSSLEQCRVVAEPLNLHARILHHCRRHLHFNRDDPFFAPWHELSADGGADAVRKHYTELLAEAAAALAEKKQSDPKATTIGDVELDAVMAAVQDTSGFLTVPAKPEFALGQETVAEYHRLLEVARILESGAPDETAVMGVADDTVLTSIPIHIRGSHQNLGDPVDRGFPEVMHTSSVRPILPQNESGRLQFARWLAGTTHPLTARVYVNRVWAWHFGTGIVASTENFGSLGDSPSHPELLDMLARQFMESGWSTKSLHRMILLSNTYQMSSIHDDAETIDRIDPGNRMLARFPIRRLTAESIRDAMLQVSGTLDRAIGGKTIPLRNRQFVFNHTSEDHTRYDSRRRAIYLPIIRNNLYSLFEQFDYPDPTMPTGTRNATVVAPQALLMMNSPIVMESADAWAERLHASSADLQEQIAIAYRQAFAREPTASETARATQFIAPSSSGYLNRWSMYCQSLFACNEFIYVR